MADDKAGAADAQKLRWLMDRAEIQDLLNAYSRGVDHGDVELLRQVYHDGARDEHGIFSGDGDAFADFAVAVNEGRFRIMQHHHTTTSMDIRGDDAEVECYFLCVCLAPDGTLQFSSGRSADRFARRGDRWGLIERQVVMDWTMAIPEPKLIPNDDRYVRGRMDQDDIVRSLLPRLTENGFFGTRPRRGAPRKAEAD